MSAPTATHQPTPGSQRVSQSSQEDPLEPVQKSPTQHQNMLKEKSDGLDKKERWVILGIMIAGTSAACISQSMMIAALPTIMLEFSVTATLGQLLTTAYIFTLGLISAMTAYLVKRISSRKLFLLSMASFLFGCIASLIAPNYPLLLVSRLLQAGGAGIALPLIQVVALSVYPKSQYGKAMGLVGIIIGFTPAFGPPLSGFLIDLWGWRSIFIALSAIALVVVLVALPFLKDVPGTTAAKQHFDGISGILYTLGFAAILISATLFESFDTLIIQAILFFLAGGTALFVFARRQFRIKTPLLKLSCFYDQTFTVSTILVIMSHVAFMSGSIMVPLFVQNVQHQSAAISGLTILPGALLLGFLNPLTGRFLDRHSPFTLIIAGCSVLVLSTLAFAFCVETTPTWVITVLYGLRTIGVSCLMMPMTAYACTVLQPKDIAQGTAIITSFRQTLASLATSGLIAVMASVSLSEQGVDQFGFHVSFIVQTIFIALVFLFSMIFMPRRKKASSTAA